MTKIRFKKSLVYIVHRNICRLHRQLKKYVILIININIKIKSIVEYSV